MESLSKYGTELANGKPNQQRCSTTKMDMNEYQSRSEPLVKYPHVGNRLFSLVFGLNTHCGQIADKVNQLLGRHGGVYSQEFKDAIAIQLGAMMLHTNQIASELGLSAEDIAQASLIKGAK